MVTVLRSTERKTASARTSTSKPQSLNRARKLGRRTEGRGSRIVIGLKPQDLNRARKLGHRTEYGELELYHYSVS